MGPEKERKNLSKEEKFRSKYKKTITYNPIRPIEYPDSERTLLRHSEVTTNVIGTDNNKIQGMFCRDAR